MKPELELLLRKDHALLEIDKLINKYEYLLSHALLEEVVPLFAVHMPDVRIELSFGKWLGAAGVKRCILGLHGKLFRDADGLPAAGTFHLNANTTGIIEVADDLRTAKGLWECPGTYSNADKSLPDGAKSMAGACLRTCDFIFDESDGQWKMWHYVVTGLFSYDIGSSPAASQGNQSTADWKHLFDDSSYPDGEPEHYWMYTSTTRMVHENFNRVPEPYRTFSETFSY